MRRLIINADDFGLTHGVNRAIQESVEQGIVTSTTLMANAAAFDEAAVLSRGFGSKAAVGCHVSLIDGAPVLPPERVQSLLDARQPGQFRDNLIPFVRVAVAGRLEADEIEAEVAAQIRKAQSAGIVVSHLDTHKHTHIFPAVHQPLLRAARACGVRAVRNPFAPVKPMAYAHLFRRPKLWKRYVQVSWLRRHADEFARRVHEEGLKTTDGTLGIIVTGALDLNLFEAIVGCVPEGTWEFVCHPGYHDAELDAVKTRLRESRVEELKVLTSPRARQMIEQAGIQLITFNDL